MFFLVDISIYFYLGVDMHVDIIQVSELAETLTVKNLKTKKVLHRLKVHRNTYLLCCYTDLDDL